MQSVNGKRNIHEKSLNLYTIYESSKIVVSQFRVSNHKLKACCL